MTDRPIIFSAPMIRALIEGRKTQTRRIIKNVPDAPQPDCHPLNSPRHPAPYLDAYCGGRRTAANPRGVGQDWHWWQVDDRPGPVAFRLRFVPGDRLWVRETACWVSAWGWRYRADNDDLSEKRAQGEVSRWYPSIHMPRKASRLTLVVTEVRVERLQDISEADAQAEGIERLKSGRGFYDPLAPKGAVYFGNWTSTARQGFQNLWNSINGHDAWDGNPWVAAISFSVHPNNIDTVEGN